MSYLKAVLPLSSYRLLLAMESDSIVVVDLSRKILTTKYRRLEDEQLFRLATTDGDYVLWKEAQVSVSAQEIMDIVLFGETVIASK